MNQPYFRWHKVPRATQYQFEVAVDSRFGKVLKTVTTDLNRFIDTTTWPAGSYWWRVKVTQPFETRYSNPSQFTRRWLVQDANGSGIEVARPDNVTVEDVRPPKDDGLQIAPNRFRISWEPVADASMYEVYWFRASPDGYRVGDKNYLGTCRTPHTVLTPTFVDVGDDEDRLPQGEVIPTLAEDGPCELPEELSEPDLSLYIRVRALDQTVDGRTIESLWSDEARDDNDSEEPARVVVDVVSPLPGEPKDQPATPTSPESGSISIDTPVLAWDPVKDATDYELIIARDRDFTTRIADIFTNNTRWVPSGRFPEDDVDRSYYWFVVPCWETGTAGRVCLSSTTAVNRPGKYRYFTKQSLTLNTEEGALRPEPWLQFSWQPYAQAAHEANPNTGRLDNSVGGIQFYEIQWAPKGGSWQSVRTDLPDWLPENLPFGVPIRWRVRIDDGSGQERPWSKFRKNRTPAAVPAQPGYLQATRSRGTRVRISWRAPRTRYFPTTKYTVYYSTTGKRWKKVFTVRGTSKRFKINRQTAYWFMVTAHNRAGEGAPKRVYVPR